MSASDSGPISIGALDLAALLCSRVCHDLISPVGAIVNGLEVLDEDKDEETKTFALDLIKKSAQQASAKLQFCRLAFGAAGSAGAQIELGDAEKVARGLIEDGKTTIVWNLLREFVPKNRAKLLLNMLMVAVGRGGIPGCGDRIKCPPEPGHCRASRRQSDAPSRCPCHSARLYRNPGPGLRTYGIGRGRGRRGGRGGPLNAFGRTYRPA
jgi:hypothetical protein